MKAKQIGTVLALFMILGACNTPPPSNPGTAVEKITIQGKILLAFEENTQERALQILTQQQGAGAAVKYLPTSFEITDAGVVKYKSDKALAGLRIYEGGEAVVLGGIKYTLSDFNFSAMDKSFKGESLTATLPLASVKGNPMEFLIQAALKKSPLKQGTFAVKSVNFSGAEGKDATIRLEVMP